MGSPGDDRPACHAEVQGNGLHNAYVELAVSEWQTVRASDAPAHQVVAVTNVRCLGQHRPVTGQHRGYLINPQRLISSEKNSMRDAVACLIVVTVLVDATAERASTVTTSVIRLIAPVCAVPIGSSNCCQARGSHGPSWARDVH